jgi:hypothetical protein
MKRILTKTEPQQLSTVIDGHRRTQLRDVGILGLLLAAGALAFFILRSPVRAAGDFVYFYSIGRLLNEHSSLDLYNYQVQETEYDKLRPDLHGTLGPSPYPPFVALFFRPFARLTFFVAHRIWMVVTLCLYLAGLWLLLRTFLPDRRMYWPAVLSGALLFWPFLGRTFAPGQITAAGFFAMSVALSEQERQHYYMSGLALSLCLYKPTLLLWILPLLVITRAWRTLAGFSTGAVLLACITTCAFRGMSIWHQYLGMMAYFAHIRSFLIRSDYVDILAIAGLATDRTLSTAATSICLCAGAAIMFLAWRHALSGAAEHRTVCAWTVTLPLALLVNVYTPIYDSVLVVVSLIAGARLLQHIAQEWLICGCLLLLAASCCTTWIADVWHIQIFSFMIAGISVLQLSQLNGRRAVVQMPIANTA